MRPSSAEKRELAQHERLLRTCIECGHVGKTTAEYHPYAFCVLVKAGLDPWTVVREAADKLPHA